MQHPTNSYVVPQPLEGCWAKVQRADESIGNLEREISTYINADPKPYELTRQFQAGGREYSFIVRGNPTAPIRFAVIAGEVVHHLRSSLDHLVTALVIANRRTPTNNNAFPICTTAIQWKNATKDGRMAGIAASAKALIAAQQPYLDANPLSHFLTVLHDMDIRDKHALLLIVCSAAQIGQQITIGENKGIAKVLSASKNPAIVAFGDPGPKIVSQEGVEIFKITLADPHPAFEANANIIVQMAFETCGAARLIPVIDALRIMTGATAALIDRFKVEFGHS